MNIKSNHGNEVRDKIMDFLKKNTVKISPVSFREISEAVDGISTSVVEYHLDILEKEGRIKRDKFTARKIKVLK